jgi:hypothetical protein
MPLRRADAGDPVAATFSPVHYCTDKDRSTQPNCGLVSQIEPRQDHIMAPTQITAAKQMDDPRAISTTAAAPPLPIAVWPLLVIAVALTATFAWVGLLIYVTVAVVTYALF